MAVRTGSIERLLEALSPTLSAEIERVIAETRESLEQEFQKRLDAAVREAEEVTAHAADSRLQQALAEARDDVRREVSAQLEAQSRKTLEDTTEQLKRSHAKAGDEALAELRKSHEETIAQLKSQWETERSRLQEQHDQWRTFAQAEQQLSQATSQTEILVRFLKFAEPFAAGLGVYVTKADGLALWKSRGKAAFPEIISQETTDPESYFKTVSVRGRTVAAVAAAQPFKIDALNFLVSSMERAIELFGMRIKSAAAPKSPSAAASPKAAAGVSAVSPPPTPPTRPTPPPQPAAQQPSPALPVNEDKAHSDARRTARLLVSEIKLYHEQELKEGRQHANIYERLQKEINRSREIYRQQTANTPLDRDYFHEEVVRILSENDPSRLGDAYPGPMNQ